MEEGFAPAKRGGKGGRRGGRSAEFGGDGPYGGSEGDADPVHFPGGDGDGVALGFDIEFDVAEEDAGIAGFRAVGEAGGIGDILAGDAGPVLVPEVGSGEAEGEGASAWLTPVCGLPRRSG